MDTSSPWPRRLLIAAFVIMVAAAVDPLEGSVIILAAMALVTFMARRLGARSINLLYVALALTTLGVAALWGLSAIGGFGGTTGRSMWLGLLILPYPAGWLMAIVGAVRALRGRLGGTLTPRVPGTT